MRTSWYYSGDGVLVKIASLPWYDCPEVRDATDALWRCLRGHLVGNGFAEVPEELERDLPARHQWEASNLLLTQACGYDVILTSREQIQVLATPEFAVPGCEGGDYFSLVVVREDSPYQELVDLRGSRCVINSPTSHSGMNCLRALLAEFHSHGHFFEEILTSGGHRRSLGQLREARVDVAAIDVIIYQTIERHSPELLAGTRVIARTPAVAAPPFVASRSADGATVSALQEALAATFRDPSGQLGPRGAIAQRPGVSSSRALSGDSRLGKVSARNHRSGESLAEL